MPRTAINTQIATPGVGVTGEVHKPYLRDVRAPSGAAQVAASLGDLSETLRRAGQSVQQVKDPKTIRAAADQAVADADTLRDQQKTVLEARSEGLITVHEDPFFQLHYEENLGRLMGLRSRSDWIATRQDTLGDAASMEEFDAAFAEWEEGFQDSHFGEADEVSLAAYREAVEGIYQNDRTEYAYKSAGKIEGMALENHTARMEMEARELIQAGATWQEIGAAMTLQQEEFQGTYGSSKGKRRAANAATFNVIAGVSRWAAREGLDSLTVLEELATSAGWGPDGAFDFTVSTFSGPYEQLQDELRGTERQARQDREATRTDEVIALSDEIRREVYDGGLTRQGLESRIESLVALGGDNVDTQAARLRGTWDAEQESRTLQDVPEVEIALRQIIYSDRTNTEANRQFLENALRAGNISHSTFKDLDAFITRYEPSGSGSADSPQAAAFRAQDYAVERGRLSASFGDQNSLGVTGAALRSQAERTLEDSWAQYIEANPDASAQDRRDFLRETVDSALREWLPIPTLYTGEGELPGVRPLQTSPTWRDAQDPAAWRYRPMVESEGDLQDIEALFNGEATPEQAARVLELMPTIGFETGTSPFEVEGLLRRFLTYQRQLTDSRGQLHYAPTTP